MACECGHLTDHHDGLGCAYCGCTRRFKNINLKHVVSIIALLLTFALSANAQTQKPEQEKLDALTKVCVEQRLAAAPSLAGQPITVSVFEGIATLRGTVADTRKKGTATRVAKSKTCGATKAINKLNAQTTIKIQPKKKGGE